MTGQCRGVASVVAAVTDVVAVFVVVVISFCIAISIFFIRVIINKTGIVIHSRVAIMMDIRLNLGKGLCCGVVGDASVSCRVRKEPLLVLCSHLVLSFITEVGPSCLDCARRGCLVVG
jgi:hypothetical protein